MTALLTVVDIADYEQTGHADGLAAGLAKVLDDQPDTGFRAPGRFLAVPAERAGSTDRVEHSMAAAEGIAIVRLPDGHPRGRSATVGLRLGAVRIGLTKRLLDLAVEHLTGRTGGGEPLIRKQLNQGTIADVLAELEMLRRYLETIALNPDSDAIADVHDQLTTLDWQVTKLFGAAGYMADHPVRALYVAGLVANTWVSKGENS
jgi:hypothetical protein